jgi:hypothetical protein
MSIKRLRKAIVALKQQRHHQFSDFKPVIDRIRNQYGYLFPLMTENRNGSKYVFEFGLPDVFPISLEKEHGSREYIPPKYAKRAIISLEELLSYIEMKVENEGDGEEDDLLPPSLT